MNPETQTRLEKILESLTVEELQQCVLHMDQLVTLVEAELAYREDTLHVKDAAKFSRI